MASFQKVQHSQENSLAPGSSSSSMTHEDILNPGLHQRQSRANVNQGKQDASGLSQDKQDKLESKGLQETSIDLLCLHHALEQLQGMSLATTRLQRSSKSHETFHNFLQQYMLGIGDVTNYLKLALAIDSV